MQINRYLHDIEINRYLHLGKKTRKRAPHSGTLSFKDKQGS